MSGAGAPPDSEGPPSSTPGERWERWINPLLQKDLLVYSRGTRAGGWGGLVGYALVFGLPLLGVAWAIAFSPGGHRFGGRHLFLVLCAILAFIHLGVVAPASTAFALERDRNTLEGLIVTPLGAWRLVAGKLATAVTVGVLAKAALLPLVAVGYALGGGEAGFLPRYLLSLLAVDISLASLALYLGHRQRDAPTRLGWIKGQTSQSQLALQTTVGISVLGFLFPFYAIGFLIPLSLKRGALVADALDVLAPLGALHPLATLAAWGDADLFGLRVPVWLLAVVFHLSVALPLVAATAEEQRPEGAAPGRLPRLLALPPLVVSAALLGAVAVRSPQAVRGLLLVAAVGVVLIVAATKTGFREEGGRPTTPRALLRGFLPLHALASRPASAAGFVAWLGLVLGLPLLVWAGSGAASAWASGLALTLAAVALAALGARLQARVREREEEAFLAALRGAPTPLRAEEDDDPEEAERRRKSWPSRVLSTLLLLGFVLPPAAGSLIGAIDAGTLPALAGLRPALGALTGIGLAVNPCGGLIPLVGDASALGTSLGQRGLAWLGVAPWATFAGHVALYATLLVGAVVTLREPLDLDRALGESCEAAEAASSAPTQADP